VLTEFCKIVLIDDRVWECLAFPNNQWKGSQFLSWNKTEP
jgi:hypothetical protein